MLLLVKNTKILGAVCAVILIFANAQVLAGPPFATDDPEPTDYQHYELYVAFQQARTIDGTSGVIPQVELNYGAVPNLQIGVAVPLAFSRPAGAMRQSGLGDIALSAKYRFLQETNHRPMAAFFPSVTLATGDAGKGLGAGATKIYLPLWLQKSWGSWKSYGGAGYQIDRSTNAKNHWFIGWQVQKEISEHLTLGGELFHSTEAVVGEGSSSGFNLGGFYNFTEHHHLLVSAGRGLSNANRTNQLSSYLGYQLTW